MDVVTLALAKKYSDEKFGSSNIWDGIEEPGTINTSTGEEEESTNGRRMPHDKGIVVDPSTTYYIKKNTSAKIRYTFYGANGEYIGNTDALGHSLVDSDVMSQKMVPPVGATLFRAFSSGSLVNAGLTVAVGIEADLSEVESKVDNLVTTINNLTATINSLTTVVDKSSSMRYIGSGVPDKWSLHKIGSIASLSIVTRESTWTTGNEIWLGFLPEDCMPLEGDIKIFAPSSLTGASGTSGANEFIVTIKGDSTIAVQPIIKLTDAKCIINLTYFCAPAQSAN